MPDSWSVPIVPGVLTDLNETIAKGQDLSWIGNLPNAYWQGKDQQFTQAQRDIFKGGIPKDAGGNIDWDQATQMLLKTGGTSQVQNLIELQKLKAFQQLNQNDQGLFKPPSAPSGEPSGAPIVSAVPPSSANAIPSGPQARQVQPSGVPANAPTSVISILGANGVPDADAGKLALSISSKLGVDPNAPVDVSNPNVRQVMTEALRSYKSQSDAPPVPPGNIPQVTPPAVPPQAAPPANFAQRFEPVDATPQAQPIQPNGVSPTTITEANAAQYEQRANALYAAASKVGFFDPKRADTYRAAADAMMKQSSVIREALAKNAELTSTQKDLMGNNAAGATEAQKLNIQRGDKTYGGIIAQATQFQRDMQPLISVLKPVLNDPKFYSGIGGDLSLDVNRVRAAFGDQRAAMLQEAVNKLTASTVLAQINVQRDQLQEAGTTSSRIFSQQVELVTKAAPALSTSVYGNRFLVTVMERMGDLSENVANIAREYKATHPLGLDTGFDKKISDYMKSNPVFTAQERSHPEILGAPTIPPELDRPGNKQAIAQWATSLGLKPGDPIRFNDGSVRSLQ